MPAALEPHQRVTDPHHFEGIFRQRDAANTEVYAAAIEGAA